MAGQIFSTIDFRSRTGGGILVPVLDDPVLDNAEFGDAALADWCDRYLDARPARVLFRSGHRSAVIGAELTDGRPVVIKSRPFDPRIAGCLAVQAAAVWPAAGATGEAAAVAQSADFIAAYQRAAGGRWTEAEIADAWAAGLWVRLFNARKDAADGGGPRLDRLAGERAGRLSRAGLDHVA